MTDDLKISPAQQLNDGLYDLPLRDNLFGASHSTEQRVYGYLDSVGIHPIDISEFLRDSRCYQVNQIKTESGNLRLPPQRALGGQLRKVSMHNCLSFV